MDIETFTLERTQSLWENTVECNLTETGIHPFMLAELLPRAELEALLTLRLGYGYTNGSPELRDAVSSLYPDAGRENILMTNGSIEANFIAVWSLLKPGDELVLMLPNYMQIWGAARAFGITVKPFYLKEALNWQPDPEELRAAVTEKTRMIAVCNPNNPTGAVLDEAHMQLLVDLAERHGCWLYADEIYRGAELSGEETPSFFGRGDTVITAGGLSKAYALPGLRIGWLAGPPQVIEKAWSHRDYTTIAVSILSDRIATAALQPEKRRSILRRNRRILQKNLDLLKNWTEKRSDLYSFHDPAAGGMAFIRYAPDIHSTAFTEQLRQQESTLIAAGDCFHMDRYLRIGIGVETACLEEGLRRLARFSSRLAR